MMNFLPAFGTDAWGAMMLVVIGLGWLAVDFLLYLRRNR